MSGTVAWATGTDVMTTIGEDGCAEQHPAGWWEQITEAAKAAIGSGTAHPDQIAAVAVTGIWGSTVPVSGEGTPVGPCLLWLDSRGAPHARRRFGGPVAGYSPWKLATWVRKTGRAPSISGADAIGHMLYLELDRPEIAGNARWYLEAVDYVSMCFTGTVAASPPSPGVVPERLANEQRVDWTRAEHQVLLQAIAQAAAVGMLTRAWQIFECQTWFLGGHGYWADCQVVGQAVLAAATAADDQDALGWTHVIIGRYCTLIGVADEDQVHLFHAMDHFRNAGDLTGQAWASLNACRAANLRGDFAEAATLRERGLHLFRRVGEQAGEMWSLYALGLSHARLGQYDLARDYAQQAFKAATAAGDPTGLALAWSALGQVHSGTGDQQQAISCYRQAVPLGRRWKTPMARRYLVDILVGFGDAQMAAGDQPAARESWLQALQILDDLRLPDNHGISARLERVAPPGRPA